MLIHELLFGTYLSVLNIEVGVGIEELHYITTDLAYDLVFFILLVVTSQQIASIFTCPFPTAVKSTNHNQIQCVTHTFQVILLELLKFAKLTFSYMLKPGGRRGGKGRRKGEEGGEGEGKGEGKGRERGGERRGKGRGEEKGRGKGRRRGGEREEKGRKKGRRRRKK